MKTIRLLLVGVLASIGLAVNAQSYLPQKTAFSIGGGLMWGISDSKGDFQDVAGSPTSRLFGAELRLYPIPNIGLGLAYNHLAGNEDGNKLRCNYVAPTFTLRGLWAGGKQGLWATMGLGYLNYKDELRYGGDFKKGYFAASLSVGYEFAIAQAVGMQIRADFIGADFHSDGYRSGYHNYENWDCALSYFSIGMALVFGK